MNHYITPDLCDAYPELVQVLEPMFSNFGGRDSFGGEIVTIKCFEDNSRVKEQAELNGEGKVLVVDGGGSLRHALLGDMIADRAISFLDQNRDRPKAEWYIPFVVNALVQEQRATVRVLPTASRWFGVTYREDRDRTVAEIARLIAEGVYPARLWG